MLTMTATKIRNDRAFRQLWMSDVPVRDIADLLGVDKDTVGKAARRFGLPSRYSTRQSRRVQPAPPAPPPPQPDHSDTPFSRACGRLARMRATGDIVAPPSWPLQADIAVLQTGGAYAGLNEAAETLGVPFSRVLARWHIVRVV